MNCPECGNTYTKVKDTRLMEEQTRWTKRRRYCFECETTFWTIELPAEDLDISSGEDEDEDVGS